MRKFLTLLALSILAACQALDSVDLTERSTFIKFFGGPGAYIGVDIKETPDGGYIGLGTIDRDTLESIVLVKLDGNGNTEWEQIYDSATAAAVIPIENGYIVAGDRIQFLEEFESLSSMSFFLTDLAGNVVANNSIGDQINELDFHTTGATLSENGDLLAIGNRENEDDSESAVLVSVSSLTMEINWVETYSLIDRNYSNGKSIHENINGSIIWSASAIIPEEDNFDVYISLPVIQPGSQFINNNLYGEVLEGNHQGIDIAESSQGYGVIGSESNEEDEAADILFLKTTVNGDIITNSERVFNITSNDRGLSISATNDGGYVLLGSIQTNTSIGNGGTDFYVIKTDFQGNEIWSTNFGGSGNEIDGRIRQTADGGYVVFGTSELQGVSSIVMIKMDENGKLKN